MTQDDIIRMARQVGGSAFDHTVVFNYEEVQRFMALVAAAEREKLTNWMWSLGYAIHGDTMEDLLDHLGTQISEGLEVEVLMEREACAKVCDGIGDSNKWSDAHDCAAAIRARSKT